jgi:hypothetical protein
MPEPDTIERPYDWDIPLPILSPAPILEVYDPESGQWVPLVLA